jgi:Protease inhibitor Inh
MGYRCSLAAETARRGCVAALIWCAPLLCSASLMAENRPPAGVWEFSLQGAAAKCRISLHSETSSSGGFQVTIPIACLRTFPVLGPVESWNKSADDRLAFLGRTGQAVLNFAAAAGVYIAVGPAGETYRLTALSSAAEGQVPRGGEEKTPAPAPGAKPHSQPLAASADAEGRYSILRDGEKDTGCMLTLDAKAKGKAKGKASLAPGCRDQGLVVFDPAAWEITNGQLVLIARKGHKAHLDAQPDGSWKKAPPEGKPLSLKKL